MSTQLILNREVKVKVKSFAISEEIQKEEKGYSKIVRLF
jgi:hypothetical protein